jgi:hypothetical protein
MKALQGLDIWIEFLDSGFQLKNLYWTLRPVMLPANDQVALFRVVPMLAEIPACELQFDIKLNVAPALREPFRSTVGEGGPDRLDEEPQLSRDHAKEEYDALFVDGLVPQFTEVQWTAEHALFWWPLALYHCP